MPIFSNLRDALYLQICPADETMNYGSCQVWNCGVFPRLVEDPAGLMYSLR